MESRGYWRDIEVLGIGYGTIVTFCSIFLTLTLSSISSANTSVIYISASALPALSFFMYRTATQGPDNTFKFQESSVALLSGLGLSAPILVLSLASSAITGDYTTAEKWISSGESMESQIQRLITELDLSENTQAYAMQLIGKVRDKELTKGRETDELSGAVIYIAARENDEPRTLGEISQLLKTSKREIGKAYRAIARNTDVRIIPPGPADHLDRFAEKLELSEDVKERALDLLEQAQEKNFTSGKSHTGLAAAGLYLSAHMEGEERSLNETSDILDITTVTIRERSKDFIRNLSIEDYPEHFEESLDEKE